ncbi:protein high chlorophyll fluorescent 107 isoform X3 [Carya illinoinensis]|uniref:protein high chlorophyll fluorescent 107 isoform X3 n=1 Tax=Carya illinoinensis TaxID=32201 RepID=UPI001C723A94|nr:protein high chlorophyll fluorescent 107 isoform X3 [Carya illinoinensis]
MPFLPSSSSSSSNSNFTVFYTSQSSHRLSKLCFKIPILPLHHFSSSPSYLSVTSCSSQDSPPPVLEKDSSVTTKEISTEGVVPKKESYPQKVLVVRRPVMEFSGDGESEESEEDADLRSSAIDAGLTEFAKKMPLFEPERVDASGSQLEKPLAVNLDLALYKAKGLARSFRYEEAQEILEKCIYYWPEDGRASVALGKILSKQSKMAEARAVYEKGCQATQGENPYLWQCWAVLENKMGNIRRARELFDAATVADKRHIAAWHGWAVLEIKQGNVKKARQLLAKALKFCGGNEYVYQTLAMLEARANRHEQARYLFRQATKCNPKSCASWLAWAQLEIQQENNTVARLLFEAWGWMEWKEGNIAKARELYQIALSINSTSESAARCLQAWGVLEQRIGNLSAARRLFRSSLNINSQSYVTWMTWASLEEDQGNSVRAEEIRNLYFQQRTEVVDDASWVMGFLDIIDPAIDSIKRLLKFGRESLNKDKESLENITEKNGSSIDEDSVGLSSGLSGGKDTEGSGTGIDLDAFISEKLSLDPSKLDVQLESYKVSVANRTRPRRIWRSERRTAKIPPRESYYRESRTKSLQYNQNEC